MSFANRDLMVCNAPILQFDFDSRAVVVERSAKPKKEFDGLQCSKFAFDLVLCAVDVGEFCLGGFDGLQCINLAFDFVYYAMASEVLCQEGFDGSPILHLFFVLCCGFW